MAVTPLARWRCLQQGMLSVQMVLAQQPPAHPVDKDSVSSDHEPRAPSASTLAACADSELLAKVAWIGNKRSCKPVQNRLVVTN